MKKPPISNLLTSPTWHRGRTVNKVDPLTGTQKTPKLTHDSAESPGHLQPLHVHATVTTGIPQTFLRRLPFSLTFKHLNCELPTSSHAFKNLVSSPLPKIIKSFSLLFFLDAN